MKCWWTKLVFLLSAALTLAVLGSSAEAQQCKPKTAGYFKQMAEFNKVDQTPVELAGIPKSLTGSIGAPERGRKLIAEEKKTLCLACHTIPSLGKPPYHGDLGPSLDGVGERYTTAQIRQVIVDAKVLFPETVMPAYHIPPTFDRVPKDLAGKTVLSASEVEDIVAFLRNLK